MRDILRFPKIHGSIVNCTKNPKIGGNSIPTTPPTPKIYFKGFQPFGSHPTKIKMFTSMKGDHGIQRTSIYMGSPKISLCP